MRRKHEPTELQKTEIIVDYLKKELEGLETLNREDWGTFKTSEETLQTLRFMIKFQEHKCRVLKRYPSARKL